jgi:hypothetical protein
MSPRPVFVSSKFLAKAKSFGDDDVGPAIPPIMRISMAVAFFFLVLAVVFAVAARNQAGSPVGKTRRRVAIIFALVATGLILMELLRR